MWPLNNRSVNLSIDTHINRCFIHAQKSNHYQKEELWSNKDKRKYPPNVVLIFCEWQQNKETESYP